MNYLIAKDAGLFFGMSRDLTVNVLLQVTGSGVSATKECYSASTFISDKPFFHACQSETPSSLQDYV